MTNKRFYYQVHAEVTFTGDDVATLLSLASRHYDATCRAAALHGGFIYGWNNMLQFGDKEVDVVVSANQLDLLSKICEMKEPSDLATQIRGLLSLICQRSSEMNRRL